MDVTDEIEELEWELYAFRDMLIEAESNFRTLADEMDKVKKDVGKSKIAGSGAAVVGGILTTVGFGLSFVTVGASLGLVIAGGVIGGAGGITIGGACVGDSIEYKKREAQAQKIVDDMNIKAKNLIQRCHRISELIGVSCNIESNFPRWTCFWKKMIMGTRQVGWNVAWKVIRTSITSAKDLCKLSNGVLKNTTPIVRTLSGVARNVHIVGGVVGAIFIPIDIAYLVYHAKELANGNEHRFAKTLREEANKIDEACPSVEEIKAMLCEISGRVEIFF